MLLGSAAWMMVGGPAAARIGVTSATDGDPLGKPPSETERVLRIGIDVQANEVVTTKANDRAHLVFLDGTSITIGPNARMTLDKFVYDPTTKKGELALTATTGVFRIVGGKISKTNAITVTTPSSTIGIRGGISIFTVTSTQTVSAFVFGQSLTVTGGGQTQTLTRAGTQTVTNLNGTPGNPTPANVAGAMGNLEGTSGKGGGTGNADQQSQNSGFSGQNSGQGTITTPPPTITTTVTNTQQTVSNVVSNSNTDQQTNTPPHAPVIVETKTTDKQVVETTTTNVIITRGRFLQEKPFEPRTFDSRTLRARRNPENNETLSPTGTASSTTTTTTTTDTTVTTTDGVETGRTSTTSSSSVTSPTLATISVPSSEPAARRGGGSGGSLTLPWMPGQIFQFTGDTPFGPTHAVGLVSVNQDFFAYSFKVDSSGQTFVLFGGTPTALNGPVGHSFPKVGIGAQTLTNLWNPGTAPGNLPFAPDRVGGDADIKAAANVSPLYSVYTPNLNGTNSSRPSVPDALQVTVSIAGSGTMQKSYMGVFVANYGTDHATNTVYGAGTFMDSYRLGADQKIGRGVSYQSTADTGAGSAIYGDTGQYQVYVPDRITTTRRRGGSHAEASFASSEGYQPHVRTRRIDGAALDQPAANRRPTSYYPVTVATPVPDPSALPADLGQNRTTQTLSGYVGGTIESRDGNRFSTLPVLSRPGDIRISTDAATNQAMASIVLRGLDGTLTTLELGGKSGQHGAVSAFIDDSRYAMITQTNDRDRQSSVRILGHTYGVNDNTMLASYKTAPVALPGGVQPCSCEYLSWGFWSANINYSSRQTDNINLGSYVVGDMTTRLQMPTTGTANFGGHMIGGVQSGANSYVGTGTYTSAWNFASRSGSFNATFDGANYSALPKLFGSGANFGGVIASGSTGRIGAVSGSFFNAPGQTAAYQGGAFAIGGPNYQASGIFAGQRLLTGAGR